MKRVVAKEENTFSPNGNQAKVEQYKVLPKCESKQARKVCRFLTTQNSTSKELRTSIVKKTSVVSTKIPIKRYLIHRRKMALNKKRRQAFSVATFYCQSNDNLRTLPLNKKIIIDPLKGQRKIDAKFQKRDLNDSQMMSILSISSGDGRVENGAASCSSPRPFPNTRLSAKHVNTFGCRIMKQLRGEGSVETKLVMTPKESDSEGGEPAQRAPDFESVQAFVQAMKNSRGIDGRSLLRYAVHNRILKCHRPKDLTTRQDQRTTSTTISALLSEVVPSVRVQFGIVEHGRLL